MTAGLLSLMLAAVSPTPQPSPQWKAVHTGVYGVTVEPGETRAFGFSVPQNLTKPPRLMTFAWTVVRPTPVPALVAFQQCPQPEVCYPTLMRPTGQGSGTTQTTFRITNRATRQLYVEFRYTVWEPR